MPRRRIWVGIVLVALVSLVIGGSTFASASPHATAAKKHHKKKGVKCTGTTHGASQLIMVGSNAGNASYYAYFHCKKSFSKFTLTTNKPVKSGSASGSALDASGFFLHGFPCQTSGTNEIKCTMVPGAANYEVRWLASQVCPTPTMLKTTVDVKGKVNTLTPSCS